MRIHLRRAAAIVTACALMLAPMTASHSSSAPPATVAAAPSTATATPAAHLQGTGAWQKLACLGCIGGFVLLSAGGSVVGVVAAIAMYPEAAALCAAGCYAAFNL
ncbi:MAG: hypothetical protein ACYC4J_06475 [Gemmatimonadaceae bacterium]